MLLRGVEMGRKVAREESRLTCPISRARCVPPSQPRIDSPVDIPAKCGCVDGWKSRPPLEKCPRRHARASKWAELCDPSTVCPFVVLALLRRPAGTNAIVSAVQAAAD